MPKGVLAPRGNCRQPHPSSPQPGQLRRCSARKDAATVPQRFCPARPEANSCSGARKEAQRRSPSLGAHLPGARPTGVYLSHLLMARGGQAGTALCFTSLLLPQPESTQPPKAASPRYYNNQQATACSEPLRRRLPGARTTLGSGLRRMASPPRAQAPAQSQAVARISWLLFFPRFPPPLKG